ncbi:tetratricopeptide repeat protein [Mucilaginibacter antarcticus]|uniref:tetratricopeptide repeat protein n=1 Tax=Mucilaginibacter antarcticus TaxID=1855725 RepID=UPI003624C870
MNFDAKWLYVTKINLAICMAIFLIYFPKLTQAQNTPVSMAVKNEGDIPVSQVLFKIGQSKADSNRVNLYLELSHLYWHQKESKTHYIDSCLIFAKTARDLSYKLNFLNGINESQFLVCRISVELNQIGSAMQVVKTVSGEEKVRLLLILGEHYIFQPNTDSITIKPAKTYLLQAINLSQAINSKRWLYQSQLTFAKFYFAQADLESGKKVMMEIIKACDQSKDYENEAHFWSELGHYIPETNKTFNDIIRINYNAVHFYLKTKNIKEAAYVFRDIATLNGDWVSIDTCEKQMLQVIAMLNSIQVTPSYATYFILANVYENKGQYDLALKYMLKALSVPESNKKLRLRGKRILGDIYFDLKMYKKSLSVYQELFDAAKEQKSLSLYILCYTLVKNNILIGNSAPMPQFLKQILRNYPPVTANDKQLLAASFGDAYNSVADYPKAEQYYLKMIRLEKKVESDQGKDFAMRFTVSGSSAYFSIGEFYVNRKRFPKQNLIFLKLWLSLLIRA